MVGMGRLEFLSAQTQNMCLHSKFLEVSLPSNAEHQLKYKFRIGNLHKYVGNSGKWAAGQMPIKLTCFLPPCLAMPVLRQAPRY